MGIHKLIEKEYPSGKNHGNYIDGRAIKKNYCGCGKKIRSYSTYCTECVRKGKRHPMYGKHHSKEARKKMSKSLKGKKKNFSKKHYLNMSLAKRGKNNPMYGRKVINHHIHLKENSDEVIKLTLSKHRQLHERAYDFLYEEYGKRGINKYLKWFNKQYGLEE